MGMVSRRRVFLGLAGVGVLGAAGYGAARAFIPWHRADGTFFNVNGLAIRGADPVAFFTQSAPVIGSDRYTLDWADVTWRFASADNLATFKSDPETYAPQYGGYCAWAVGAKGLLYSTQPQNWSIVDGKLYLNFNDQVQETWETDVPGFIAMADQKWPSLRDQMV